MPFEAQVVELSQESLDNFFDSSPTADKLALGADASPNGDDKKVTDNKQESTQFVNSNLTDVPFYDDKLDEVEEKKEDEKVIDEDKKIDPIVDDKTKETTNTEDEDQANPELEKQKNDLLTTTVDYLIKSGKWVDFEGREDLEITEDIYADLVAKQDDYRLSNMFNELIDSTGDYGKAIFEHIKNQGNPDDIIDLFKEQKQLEQIDTSTEVGKQTKIEKYYSEVLNWKPEKVEKTIKRLIADDEIESEFKDVEDLYNEHFKEELNKKQEAAKEQQFKAKQQQDAFANTIKEVLTQDTTLSDSDRKLIQSSVFDFKHKLPSGQKVNDFYIKFAEIQQDPKQYVDLVRYIMDKENYMKSIQRKEQTNANKNAFSFIKNGAALQKAAASPTQINENPTKQYKGTNFSFAKK